MGLLTLLRKLKRSDNEARAARPPRAPDRPALRAHTRARAPIGGAA